MSRDRTRSQAFLADVKAGLPDAVLQEKYGLSEKKFYLYKAAALDIIAKVKATRGKNARKIDAKRFVTDIKSGMEDESLMIRYTLTPRELQTCFRKVIEAGLMGPLELGNRLTITRSQVREAFVEMGKAIEELD
ncbi:MAG: hypothetical protein HY913_17125 [Desulfomonile tiedjei]|nr:hypothetical protein [Desulfomonile tiedjei]